MTFAIYALFVGAWTALRFTPVSSFRLFELADLFAWVMYVPLPFFILLAAIRLRLKALVLLMIPVMCFAGDYGPMFFPQAQPPKGSELKVMTANLFFLNSEAVQIAALIKEVDPDVVAFHELSKPMSLRLKELLGSRYISRAMYPRNDALGMGLMSKTKMTEISKPSLGRNRCSCQEVGLSLKGQPIRIISAHPLPPGHSPETFNPDSQAATIAALIERAKAETVPFLMMGDFNTSDRHRFYRRIRKVAGDSFRDAGSGFGFTWPARLPLVRIDHIFHSPRWQTKWASSGTIIASDHRWVAATVVLP